MCLLGLITDDTAVSCINDSTIPIITCETMEDSVEFLTCYQSGGIWIYRPGLQFDNSMLLCTWR